MKRFLTMLLAAALVFSLCACGGEDVLNKESTGAESTAPVGAESESPAPEAEKETELPAESPVKTEGSLEFELTKTGDSYRVVGIGTCVDENLIVPSEYEGLPVTEIGGLGSADIKTVVLPDSITRIRNDAFKGCEKLTSVKFGAGLQEIGARAFMYCTGLTEVILPDSCTVLLEDAFAECTSLAAINIPNGTISLVDVFDGCTALTALTVPETVINIRFDTDTMPEITFENRENAYVLNDAKEKLWLADREAINAYMKENLGNITYRDLNLVDENGIRYQYAERSWDLKYTTEDLALKVVGTENENLVDIVIPASLCGTPVFEIDEKAFQKNQTVVSVRIENGLQVIGKDSFYQCPALTKVFIPASVTSIEYGAFAKCNAITVITVESPENWVNSKEESVDLSTNDAILQQLVVKYTPITKNEK